MTVHGHGLSTAVDAACPAYGRAMAEQPRFAGIEFPQRPMIAVTAAQLPLDRPGGWAFEPKFDGFRCLAFRSRGRVALQSRQQRPLGRYFPEIVDAVGELAADVVLDGVIFSP